VERLSLWELCEGNPEGGSLAGDPERHVERALETGISLHRALLWGTWRGGSSAGDFKMWVEGSSGNGASLSMGALFMGPLKAMKGRLWGWASLLMGLRWATWSGPLYWGLRDMVKRGSRGGAPISVGAL
jgi:hypothetical protein